MSDWVDNKSGSRDFGSGGGFRSGGGRDRKDTAGNKKKRPRRPSFRRRRPPATLEFDYKNVSGLVPFLTEEGKIMPARVSELRAGQQRQLTLAVKRARNLAFISPISKFNVIK